MSSKNVKLAIQTSSSIFVVSPKMKLLMLASQKCKRSTSDRRGSFDSVVQEAQHSTVRISKALLVSANSQS